MLARCSERLVHFPGAWVARAYRVGDAAYADEGDASEGARERHADADGGLIGLANQGASIWTYLEGSQYMYMQWRFQLESLGQIRNILLIC